jgi:nucleotide-binding universal stress UspA family protein
MASTDILVPTDFRPGSRAALLRAMQSLGGESGRICILHVLDQRLLDDTQALLPEITRDVLHERLQQHARARYEELVAGLETGASELELVIVEGLPFLKIVQLARDFDMDMIVMTVHRDVEHVEQLLFGSTAERVLRMAPCPVLIVPDTLSERVASEP